MKTFPTKNFKSECLRQSPVRNKIKISKKIASTTNKGINSKTLWKVDIRNIPIQDNNFAVPFQTTSQKNFQYQKRKQNMRLDWCDCPQASLS